MAISFLFQTNWGLGQNGGTSSGHNTTGCNFLAIAVGIYSAGTGLSVSDSKSNTWTGLTLRTTGNSSHQLFYAKNAISGTSHNFTVTGTNIYTAGVLLGFSGVDTVYTFDQQIGTTGASPIQTGSLTPSYDNSLLLSSYALEDFGSGSIAVDSGFSAVTQAASFGFYGAVSLAYKIQTAKAAVNPSWSWTGGFNAAVMTASFLAPLTQPDRYIRSSVSG